MSWLSATQKKRCRACGYRALHQPVIAGARARAPGAPKELVNAEVFGDSVYACEPKDKQCDGERADERERNQAKAHDPVEHEPPRATGKPPGPDVSRERFDRHRT
jgi:hypothetical protein